MPCTDGMATARSVDLEQWEGHSWWCCIERSTQKSGFHDRKLDGKALAGQQFGDMQVSSKFKYRHFWMTVHITNPPIAVPYST